MNSQNQEHHQKDSAHKRMEEVILLVELRSFHASSDVEAECRQRFISNQTEDPKEPTEGETERFLYRSKYSTICTIIQQEYGGAAGR